MTKGEVKWLVESIGIKPSTLSKKGAFDNRLRVQKVAFLLSHLGVKPFSSYGFSLYLRGPYSPTLAKEYYNLGGVRAEPVAVNSDTLKLMKWFVAKDAKWLEVASSILAIRERHNELNPERLCSTLRLSKPWVTTEMFESVRADLASSGL